MGVGTVAAGGGDGGGGQCVAEVPPAVSGWVAAGPDRGRCGHAVECGSGCGGTEESACGGTGEPDAWLSAADSGRPACHFFFCCGYLWAGPWRCRLLSVGRPAECGGAASSPVPRPCRWLRSVAAAVALGTRPPGSHCQGKFGEFGGTRPLEPRAGGVDYRLGHVFVHAVKGQARGVGR